MGAEMQRWSGSDIMVLKRCRGGACAEVQVEVQRCAGAEVQILRCRGDAKGAGAEMQFCNGLDDIEVLKRFRGAKVQKCRSAEVQRCRGAEVQVQRCTRCR